MPGRAPRRLLMMASIGLALLVALFLINRTAPDVKTPAPVAATTGEQAPESVVLAATAPLEAPAPEREIAVSEPEVGEEAPPLAFVMGRCVAAESGAPLAGCTVEFSGWGRNSGAMAQHGALEWTDPEPVVTGADGKFEFAFVPPPPFQHHLDVACEGRTPRTARWGAFEPGQVEDLGDIELRSGYVVEGRVVDMEGAVVAGVRVRVGNLPLPIAEGMAANDTRSGSSGEEGRFVIAVPIPAGTWSLDAGARGLKLVSPDTVTVEEGSGAAPVTVVVRRMPSISGIVVDEHGAPVERVTVEAELHRSGRMASGWTREDGTFTIHAVDEKLSAVRLRISDSGPCEPPDEPTPPYEWGTSDVRIELQRAFSFELIVVESGSATPVEDYSVICFSSRANSSRERRPRLGGNHPQGRVTVDKVWSGTSRLVVLPNDLQLAASEAIEIEAGGATLAPVRVEVERLESRPVRVLTGAGAPAAGSKVELIREGSEALQLDSFVPRREGFTSVLSSNPDYRQHFSTSEVLTDGNGDALLPVPREKRGTAIRVTGADHQPLLERPVRFPEDGSPLILTVPTGGRLSGTLAVEGYESGLVSISIRSTAGGSGRSVQAELDASGRFSATSLPAGQYDLYLGLSYRYKTEHGSSGGVITIGKALATVAIEEGRDAEVELDASHLTAGSVRGVVHLDGVPVSDCRVVLARTEGDSTASFGQFVPDPAGRFEASGLPPGDYRPGIVVGDYKAGEGDRIQSEEAFVLAPGQHLEQSFAFERLRLRLRVLRADGETPVANTEVNVNGRTLYATHRTDADGWLTLDPAPRESFALYAEKLWSDPVEMPAAQREAELEIVLRERD